MAKPKPDCANPIPIGTKLIDANGVLCEYLGNGQWNQTALPLDYAANSDVTKLRKLVKEALTDGTKQ